MTASIEVEGAQVIAAMTPPTSKAPFNRGRLVLRASDGTTIRVRTYTNDGRAEGPILSAEDLRELIGTEQITDLAKAGSICAVSGASLWVLRPNFSRRDRALTDLQLSGLLLHPVQDGERSARLCVVAEGRPEGSAMLDRWRNEAMEAAKTHARHGDWDRARLDAEFAQAVCRGLDADVLALLSLAYEKCGRDTRASGILVMARRSRGEEFEAQVAWAREQVLAMLANSSADRADVAQARLRAGLRAALQRFSAAAPYLDQRRSARLAIV